MRGEKPKLEQNYSVLFEPVRIGPVVAKNRFYQAPHGCGYGHREPSAMIAMRRVKAEGGWGVVATEQVEIHPSTDMTPLAELRLWDDRDLPVLAAMAKAVHAYGALAAIELSHSGANTANHASREPPIAPSTTLVAPCFPYMPEPWHARGMDGKDIAAFRRWHREAAERAVAAGFDIIYVYASLLLSLPNQYLSLRFNRRTDTYGGSLANRTRLLAELIDDTLEVAQGRSAVAVRLTVDELLSPTRDEHPALDEFLKMLGEKPDLWDLVVCGMGEDAGSSRFDTSSQQATVVAYAKRRTSKPVVSVGLFSMPDDMIRLIRDEVLDLIGAARPSISDPFLPEKIRTGRITAIRRCIKCNLCVAGDFAGAGVACTQNPTFGEEWRRGWHPEQIPRKRSSARILVVGGGPAGLECACALGERGYEVRLCESEDQLGGRVSRESRLPGLGLWAEVREHRLARLIRLPNVTVLTGCVITAESVLATRCHHAVVATGAYWRRDGLGRPGAPVPTLDPEAIVLTPDDILGGHDISGRAVLYDDDHYYMGGVLAELLVDAGCHVTLITPAAEASVWTHQTMEQRFIQRRLIEAGVEIRSHRHLDRIEPNLVTTRCIFTRRTDRIPCDALVMVAARQPRDDLLLALHARENEWAAAGLQSVQAIGDALAPGLIMHAVRSGHRYARELDEDPSRAVLRREVTLPHPA